MLNKISSNGYYSSEYEIKYTSYSKIPLEQEVYIFILISVKIRM